MKNVERVLLLLIIVFLYSCAMKKDISVAKGESESITVLNFKGSDMYALRLPQISEISGDTLMIENPVSAVEYVLETGVKVGGGVRPVIYRNTIEVLNQGRFKRQEGKVLVFDFCVNREGTVISANYADETNALFNEGRKDAVLLAVMGYRVEADETAKPIECGSLTIKITSVNDLGF